jgi:hypothetical protein
MYASRRDTLGGGFNVGGGGGDGGGVEMR